MKQAIGWAVAVALLVGGGFLGDHFVRSYFESRAAEAFAKAADTNEKVIVGLGGVPFSLALLTKSVPQASLSVASFSTSIHGRQTTLTDFRAASGTVQISGDSITAVGVSGTALISYPDFGELVGAKVAAAEGGRIKISSSIDLFGRTLTADISALPTLDVDAQVIRLTEPKLELGGAGELEVSLSQLVFDQLAVPLEYQLPGSLRLTSFVAGSEAVLVGFTGEAVTIPLR